MTTNSNASAGASASASASASANTNATKSVGASVPRVDGAAKVTGSALYVDDLQAEPGELFGATVRSAVPRGRLRGVRLDPAFDFSDVTVVLPADVPTNVVALIVDDQPILADREIRHAYEPVALLACADKHKLARALAAVSIDVEPLPAVLSIDDALAARERIHGDDNIQKRYLITKGAADVGGEGEALRDASLAAIDEVIARCDVVVHGRYSSHHQEQLYIEPQGVVAWWDEAGAHATGSIQCPYYVHKAFMRAFGLPAASVHVAQSVTGGGFGGKEEYPSIIAIHAALLAKKSGKRVRMVYGRKEDIEATTKRHPCVCEITSGCDKDGTLRALKMRVVMDGGAYVTLTPVVLSRGTLHASGAYRWDHARIESLAVATNTPPNGAFRGFGAPQTIWAIERHIDRVARELGRDPMDLKAQNALRVGDVTATGQALRSSVAATECITKALAESGYTKKRAELAASRAADASRRVARGIGAASFMHGAGFTGSGERYLKGKAAVDLIRGDDGEPRLRIRTASTDIGQGTETVFRQIASDAAGVPIDRVDFAVPCTTYVPDSGPTVASRTVMVVGSIVEAAAKEIAERVAEEQRARGGDFNAAALRLTADEVVVTSLKQYDSPAWVVWDDATYKGDAYPCFAWACDVAEVAVDLDTFEVTVEAFWSATDVGKAINPIMCKGQVEGGSLQAIGWALSEEIVWKGGLIMNPRMTNYIVPTALDAPRFHTILVEDPFPIGPSGAKGIGELPMDGGAPAIAAAIEDALGIALTDLPMTPEKIFRGGLGEAKRGQRKEEQRMKVSLTINGAARELDAPPLMRLLDALRGPLGLTGTKEGCGEGECGSCTVLLDGDPVNACLVAIGQCEGRAITTVEGLADAGHLTPLQRCFIEEGGAQCGICTPGMLIAAEALLVKSPSPSDSDVREALAGNICRCTGYQRIVDSTLAAAALRRAAGEKADGGAERRTRGAANEHRRSPTL